MNTPPDETTLTLWMDGQLSGDELESMESWAKDHPELLAERDAVRAMSSSIQEALPKSIEPPYPDFFNQRILNAIEETPVEVAKPAQQSSGGIWRWLAAPLAAGAMAVCFYLGTQMNSNVNPTDTPVASSVPSVYTPDSNVKADIYQDDAHNATVIVIKGLNDIPDELEMAGAPLMDPNKVMVTTEPAF